MIQQIRELRDQHEKQARYGEVTRTSLPSLPSLLRQVNKCRAKDLNTSLEGHISPNLGERSIDGRVPGVPIRYIQSIQ